MTKDMPFGGELSLDMMYRTCGTQLNLDYCSEEDFKKKFKIVLKNKSNIGEDTLKLFFRITKNADLLVKCFDVKDEFFGEYNLGNIF